MKTWPTLLAVVALAFAVACSSPPPAKKAAAEEPAADSKGKKKSADGRSVEARADEIIADLRKREAEQGKIQEKVTGRVPVIVEVSPSRGAGGTGTAGDRYYSGPGIYPGSSPSAGINSADANYWRQEYSIASAKLQSSQRRLEDARRRMNEAQQQINTPNAALRKIGQDAYTRAQQEYSQAQSAYYEDQSAVDRARSAAMNAGVPASALR